MKTPEEYFQEMVTPPEEGAPDRKLSEAEEAFLEKYVGLDQEALLSKMRPVEPEPDESLEVFAPPRPKPLVAVVLAETKTEAAVETEVETKVETKVATQAPVAAPVVAAVEAPVQVETPAEVATEVSSAPAEPDMDEQLRREPELQLVSFFLGKQEYAVPIITIQEVIRYIEPTKLPEAPDFLAGIINLRGRVTPLVSLRTLLELPDSGEPERFIIVCRHKGLQTGFMVNSVATMYRAPQEKIEWGVEAKVGIQSSFLRALLKAEGRLINILSVERLVERVMSR